MIDIDDIFDLETSNKNKKLEYGISLDNDLEEWIKTFNTHLNFNNRTKNTKDSYNFTLNAFRDYCNRYLSVEKGICSVEVSHCNDFLLWMENYEINSKYGSLKERISYLVDFIKFSKNTTGDFIELRDKYLKSGLIKSSLFDNVVFSLSEFEDFHYENEIPVSDIDNEYLKRYILWLPKASVTTMQNRRAVIHKFFAFIAEEAETDCFKDIMKKMKEYKKQNSVTTKVKVYEKIDKEKLNRFLAFLEQYIDKPSIVQKRKRKNSKRVAYRDAAMITLMYRGGLRASEALKTRLCDIKESGDTYRVDVIGGKGNKNRTTYFKKKYFKKYYDYFKKELNNEQEHLSQTSNNNKPLNRRTLYLNTKKLFEALEKRDESRGFKTNKTTGLHLFRHLFGSEFAEKNGNMKILQDLLGHSNGSTTMIYSDVAEKAKENAVQ